MSSIFIIFSIFIPFIAGIIENAIKFPSRKIRLCLLEILVIINSILVWCLIINRPDSVFHLVQFTGDLELAFKIDGMGMIFAGLVSFLWPFATLYAFEYMTHEEREEGFFMFYTMTYGVTLGISFAANLLTMYFFYELLTLVTVPLVMHTMTREAILASRKYLYYSLGGAAFAFIGLVFIIMYGGTTDFVLGGCLNPTTLAPYKDILLLIYVLAFMGFGVKAAICPFNSWLPDAGVAPTPVTALLHAVAVVKSGAFATIRLTYYCYGIDFLKDSWAQYILMAVIIFTIVYGCSRAVKETHIKRRLAFSTVSNLSYILFGVIMMSPVGLMAAITHLIAHAFMKICSFFCAGAIMYKSGAHYVDELDGMGKKMPWVFGIFTVSSFALMGVPGLSGFISKWYLVNAAIDQGSVLATIGVGALLVSAILTAIYMLSIVIRAFFPFKEIKDSDIRESADPTWQMLLPLCTFVVFMVVFGCFSKPLTDVFWQVANGVIY